MDMEAKLLTPPSPGARKSRARKPRARPQSLEAVVKARIKGEFIVRIDLDTGAMLAAIAKEAGLRGKRGIAAVMEQVIQSAAESAREAASPIRPVREPGVRRGD
jgi:2-hydroxychromene-2-carboxylate isomerase